MAIAAAQACAFFLARLNIEVGRLRQVPFPGHDTGPRKWLNLIAGLIDTASGYLKSAAAPGILPADATQLVKDAERLSHAAYQFLTHVSGAGATDIPHQVVAPFKEWVRRLKIKDTIFFRAEHVSNYELATFDALQALSNLNNPAPSLTKAIQGIEWPARRVTVPSHAMGMLPHFAVVAHELGHAIQESVRPDLAPFQQTLSTSMTAIANRLQPLGLPYGQKEIIRTGDTLKAWIDEIKADAVGHFLAGPAFLFALFGFIELSDQGYGLGASHPPSDLRRDLLMTHLAQGNPSFIQVMQADVGVAVTATINSPHIAICPLPDQLFTALSSQYPPLEAAIFVELIPYLRAIGPTIFQAALACLNQIDPKLVYTPAQLRLDLARHLSLLCQLVPPIEFVDAGTTNPTALSSILNVGWAMLLGRLDQFPKPPDPNFDPDAQKMERVHELLLKAAELSNVRRLWEESK